MLKEGRENNLGYDLYLYALQTALNQGVVIWVIKLLCVCFFKKYREYLEAEEEGQAVHIELICAKFNIAVLKPCS